MTPRFPSLPVSVPTPPRADRVTVPSHLTPARYDRYARLVPEPNVLDALARGRTESRQLLASITDEVAEFYYAANKWSIKEVIGHLIDAERSIALAALAASRGKSVKLAFDLRGEFVKAARYGTRAWCSLTFELLSLREANLIAFRSLAPGTLEASFYTEGVTLSVDTLLRVLLGHERHHLRMVKEVYLQRS